MIVVVHWIECKRMTSVSERLASTASTAQKGRESAATGYTIADRCCIATDCATMHLLHVVGAAAVVSKVTASVCCVALLISRTMSQDTNVSIAAGL
jgi:hypothetical protein